jgi:hypothetical protein
LSYPHHSERFTKIASSSTTSLTDNPETNFKIPTSLHNEAQTSGPHFNIGTSFEAADKNNRKGKPNPAANTSPPKRRKESNIVEDRVSSQSAGVNRGPIDLKQETRDEGLQDMICHTNTKRSGATLLKKTRRPKKSDNGHDLATGGPIPGNRCVSKASATNSIETSAFN